MRERIDARAWGLRLGLGLGLGLVLAYQGEGWLASERAALPAHLPVAIELVPANLKACHDRKLEGEDHRVTRHVRTEGLGSGQGLAGSQANGRRTRAEVYVLAGEDQEPDEPSRVARRHLPLLACPCSEDRCECCERLEELHYLLTYLYLYLCSGLGLGLGSGPGPGLGLEG